MKHSTKKIEGAIVPAQTSLFNSEVSPKYGTLYKSTGALFIITDCFKGVPRQFEGTVRSYISGFTAGSSGRMRRYLRECLPDYKFMLTLTYPGFFPSNGQTVKHHLKRFLQELKRYVARCGGDVERFSAFWFLEFQGRGAPHYHLFLTDQFPKDWVATTWYFIVGSDDVRHQQAGTRIESIRAGRAGIMAYAAKYAVKNEQKVVPTDYENVGRFWGVTGWRATKSATTFVESKPDTNMAAAGSVFLLIKTLNSLLFNGHIELIRREEGSAVFAIGSEEARRKLLARVCHVQAQTGYMDQLFLDADVEIGESLPAIVRDSIQLITDKPAVTMRDLYDLCKSNREKQNETRQTEAKQTTIF